MKYQGVLKKMMTEWETAYPDRKEVVFNALKNVSPTHLLDKDFIAKTFS